MMTAPSAPYYPPAFNMGNNLGSPLHPAMGHGMNKGNMMQMNMLNQVGPMDGMMGNEATTRNFTTTQVVVGGPGMNYFSPTPHPISTFCPRCKNNIVTRVQTTTGCLTHLVAGGLCLVGCGLCFYIPYLVDSFKDMEHICPQCGHFIGVYKRM